MTAVICTTVLCVALVVRDTVLRLAGMRHRSAGVAELEQAVAEMRKAQAKTDERVRALDAKLAGRVRA